MDDRRFLYVTDWQGYQVRRWQVGETQGTVVAGGNESGNRLDQLNNPRKIFVDRDRSVYVSDWNNHRVMKWVEGAKEGIVVAGGNGIGDSLSQLSKPEGVVVDQLGTVYVADRLNHRIMRWLKGATEGQILVGGKGAGSEPDQLNEPIGLSFDRYGNLFVVDAYNHRVQKYPTSSDPTRRRRSRSRSPISNRRKTHVSLDKHENEWRDERFEQKHLEQEILERKLRAAKWRLERELELVGDEDVKPSTTTHSTGNVNSKPGEGYNDDTFQGTTAVSVETDEEDPLDKYMEGIKQELTSYHTKYRTSNNTVMQSNYQTKVSVINQNGTIIRIIKKNNTTVPNQSKSAEKNAEIEFMDTLDQSLATSPSKTHRVIEKGIIMEQDIDGIEYSPEDECTEETDGLSSMISLNGKKSKADSIISKHNEFIHQPFRKDFYIAVPEIAQMTATKVAHYRRELDNMKIAGKNCPNPIKTWSQCITSTKILKRLKKDNYEKPTSIQTQALPIILSGRNMMGIAQTGSGKTLAFLLPMFRHIEEQPPLKYQDGPIAIVMTPTRELALQITKECRKFAKLFDIRCVAVYGGIGVAEQISELKRGAEIIVCTPGRMIDMLALNNNKVTNLRRVMYVVIDEADRMFDMGFEPQIRTILNSIRPDRQLVMFSATFPKKMEALARQHLYKPIEVTVGGRSIVCQDVVQNVLLFDDDDQKYAKLLELLGLYQPHSYSCMPLHGGLDQYDRDSTIAFFKNGDIPLIIATSVAARGLDVKNLILVVNYDCPNHYEEYVHRCGRTGRAGNIGYAYTFITSAQEKYVGAIIKALEASGTSVPAELTLLRDNYVKQMEAQGKKVQDIRGSFGGRHGYNFDSSDKQHKNMQKRMQGILIGLEDANDDDEEIDQQIESIYKIFFAVSDTVIKISEIKNKGYGTDWNWPKKVQKFHFSTNSRSIP
ncbi:unnamed protein product [Rotaria sp. Silwood2]|nr:unnamed protein product [Rotaria sp. Silwood2]